MHAKLAFASAFAAALSPWMALAEDQPNCISGTNQACLLSSCASGTSCSGGTCFCPAGQCATMTGTCETATYTKLPETYMISNSRWPDHFMDMGSVSGAGVTGGFPSSDEHKFHIYVLTGPSSAGLGIILTSKKWPDYSIACGPVDQKNPNERIVISADVTDSDVGVLEASLKLLVPPVQPPGFAGVNVTFAMIQNLQSSHNLMVSVTGYSVGAYTGDWGAGSYWYIQPALPDEVVAKMHSYTGVQCSLNCGTPQTPQPSVSSAFGALPRSATLVGFLASALLIFTLTPATIAW